MFAPVSQRLFISLLLSNILSIVVYILSNEVFCHYIPLLFLTGQISFNYNKIYIYILKDGC